MAQNSDDKEQDEIQQKINSLLDFHQKKLNEMKESLQNPNLKTISRQLLQQAIEDKEELIKNLSK